MLVPISCIKMTGSSKFDVDRQTDMTDNYPRVCALELELYIF